MRFKLFGFKGNISILQANKEKKKKPSKDDDGGTITGVVYRTFSEFDQPLPPPPPRRDVSINKASTSTAKTNGNLSHYKKDKTSTNSASTLFAKVRDGYTSNGKLEPSKKAVSASQPELNLRPRAPAPVAPTTTTSTVDKPKAIPVAPPIVPQEIPAASKAAQANNDANVTATNESLIAAQSMPNINYAERNVKFEYVDDDDDTDEDDDYYTDDEEDNRQNQADNGGLTVVSGRTTKNTKDDNDVGESSGEKNSTLIFKSEDYSTRDDDDDDDDDEDDDSDSFFTNRSKYQEETEYDRRAIRAEASNSNEYSSQAASIFFSDSVPEPAQRNRTFKYRNDDDNGSQTSA